VFWTVSIAIAFLCGSIPSGYLIGRAHGIDIRTKGSGNIGATNVGRVLGSRAWLLCFGADFLKGFVPTLAVGWYAGFVGRLAIDPADAILWLVVMATPMLGHIYCPWLGFKGGKGVATGLGCVLAVAPVLSVPGAMAFVVFALALSVWRYVSLGSILAASTLPLSTLAVFLLASRTRFLVGAGEPAPTMQHSIPFVVITALIAALVVVKHRTNIARLRAGTEPKVGARKPAVAP